MRSIAAIEVEGLVLEIVLRMPAANRPGALTARFVTLIQRPIKHVFRDIESWGHDRPKSGGHNDVRLL